MAAPGRPAGGPRRPRRPAAGPWSHCSGTSHSVTGRRRPGPAAATVTPTGSGPGRDFKFLSHDSDGGVSALSHESSLNLKFAPAVLPVTVSLPQALSGPTLGRLAQGPGPGDHALARPGGMIRPAPRRGPGPGLPTRTRRSHGPRLRVRVGKISLKIKGQRSCGPRLLWNILTGSIGRIWHPSQAQP